MKTGLKHKLAVSNFHQLHSFVKHVSDNIHNNIALCQSAISNPMWISN